MEQSYRLFGVNEFAARFPSALFGVGLILIHYLFLVHQREQTVALFGGLMLLLNLEILGLGRMALTDSVLIFSPRRRCTDSGLDCMEKPAYADGSGHSISVWLSPR